MRLSYTVRDNSHAALLYCTGQLTCDCAVQEQLEEGLKARGLWRARMSKAKMAELMQEAFLAEQDEIQSEGSEELLELLQEAENPAVSRGAG
jgi:hypothetical protein